MPSRPRPTLSVLAVLEKSASGIGTNAENVRGVGLPLAYAIVAMAAGRSAEAVEQLLPIRSRSYRIGGSHAQRDLVQLTVIGAALAAGNGRVARALAAERTGQNPASPMNWRLRPAFRRWRLGRGEEGDEHAGFVAARSSIAAPHDDSRVTGGKRDAPWEVERSNGINQQEARGECDVHEVCLSRAANVAVAGGGGVRPVLRDPCLRVNGGAGSRFQKGTVTFTGNHKLSQ
jgi:hypothetical protein